LYTLFIYVGEIVKRARCIDEASVSSVSSMSTTAVTENAEVWSPCSEPHKMFVEARRLLSNEDW